MASVGAQLKVIIIIAPFFPFDASGCAFPLLFCLEHRTMVVSLICVCGSPLLFVYFSLSRPQAEADSQN